MNARKVTSKKLSYKKPVLTDFGFVRDMTLAGLSKIQEYLPQECKDHYNNRCNPPS